MVGKLYEHLLAKKAEINLLFATYDLLREIKKHHPTFKSKKFNLFLTNSVNKKDFCDNEVIFRLEKMTDEFKKMKKVWEAYIDSFLLFVQAIVEILGN